MTQTRIINILWLFWVIACLAFLAAFSTLAYAGTEFQSEYSDYQYVDTDNHQLARKAIHLQSQPSCWQHPFFTKYVLPFLILGILFNLIFRYRHSWFWVIIPYMGAFFFIVEWLMLNGNMHGGFRRLWKFRLWWMPWLQRLRRMRRLRGGMSQGRSFPETKRLVLQWHLTNRCNLHCSHCYQQSFSGREPDGFEISQVIKQFKELLFELGKKNIFRTHSRPYQHHRRRAVHTIGFF